MKSERQKALHTLFRKHNRMDHGMQKSLKELGLTIEMRGSGHWKITCESTGKFIFVAQTPSDRRSTKNTVRDICRILE